MMDQQVTIEKLVNGGQGLGTLPDGRKVFVWNALPGETVTIRVIKTKRSYAEAIAEEVITASPNRLSPRDTNFLATSPWQILEFATENEIKADIVRELFEHEKVELPQFGEVVHDDREWHYRSKMEYSFWGDDDGLHLALHQRGSHGKQIVDGSSLAMPAIDAAARAVCQQLNARQARAGDFKTVIVRCNQAGEAVAALFTKLPQCKPLELTPELNGIRIYHSNPKSPASVPTELLYEAGDVLLHDELLGRPFVYDVDSFFQVNLPVFERALTEIKRHITAPSITDMYAGVGSIGLSVAGQQAILVEIDPASVRMAAQNASGSELTASVVESSTEQSLEYITSLEPVIFDPPRAGLHNKVVDRVLEALPPQVVYLSCNPATQARDLAHLQAAYSIKHFSVYNFFPKTPHIETLAVLERL